MSVVLKGVDSVEFAVKSLKAAEIKLPSWGFKKVAAGQTHHANSSLWLQGKVRFLVSEGTAPKSPHAHFVKKHGDGIYNITFEVDDVSKTFETVTKLGAKALIDPKK